MNDFFKFLRLSINYKFVVIETLLLLALSKVLLFIVPFKFIVPFLGKKNKESVFEMNDDELPHALMVSNAISIINAKLPWESLCFPQAIAGYLMLKSRTIPRTLYLGVKKVQGKLHAHAWIRVGDKIITGQGKIDEYAVIFYVS